MSPSHNRSLASYSEGVGGAGSVVEKSGVFSSCHRDTPRACNLRVRIVVRVRGASSWKGLNLNIWKSVPRLKWCDRSSNGRREDGGKRERFGKHLDRVDYVVIEGREQDVKIGCEIALVQKV